MYKHRKQSSRIYWQTNGRNFITSHKIPLTFVLPEFCPTKEIIHTFAIDETKTSSHYDTIMERDLNQLLKINVLFSKGRLIWNDLSILMKTAP